MGRLDYVLSDDDYVAFNTDVYRYSPGFVAASRAQRNLLCLVVPLAIVCIGALQGYPLLVLVVGGLAAAAVLWLLWPRLVTQSVRSQLKRAKASGVLSRTGAVALTWDDQRVYETFHDMGCYVAGAESGGWPKPPIICSCCVARPTPSSCPSAQVPGSLSWPPRHGDAFRRRDPPARTRLNPAVQGERPGREEESVDRAASRDLRSAPGALPCLPDHYETPRC